MKCPKCCFDHPAREGTNCRKCKYCFVFDPKSSNTFRLTDGKFLAAIRRCRQNGTVVYTENQLYAGLVGIAKFSRNSARVMSLILVGALIYCWFADPRFVAWPVHMALCIGLLAALYFSTLYKPYVVKRIQFESCVKQWQKSGNEIPGLIEWPSLHEPPPSWTEDDIYDYGVERVLLVQHDLLVDLFVLNNQHAELRMLVISQSGYPNYLQSQLNRVLLERPDLPVFLFHDADPTGTSMKRDIRKLNWADLRNHPLIDLGFFPDDFKKLKRTANFRNRDIHIGLPADSLRMGSLTTGLSACFASQTTFADELVREDKNQMDDHSSFG